MRKREELVKNWRTRDVVTISPDASLPEAHRLMTRNNIRRLPVIKDGKLVGIVTRGDVRGAEPSQASSLTIWEINYLLAKLKIKEIMSSNPLTVAEEITLGEVAKIMLDNKVSGLPVLDSSVQV